MLIPDPTIATILWCIFALLCGGLIKGALGIGTPLLTIPMLTLVLPAQSAVVLMAIPIAAANLWQSLSGLQLRSVIIDFAPIAIALMVATHFGTQVLNIIDEGTLLMLVGAIILAVTAQQATRYRFSIPQKYRSVIGIMFGTASGLIGGLSSMFGPMLILYLVSLKELPKEQFVSAISFLYLCAVIPWALSLHFSGLLAGDMLKASSIATIPVAIGLIIGEIIRRRISDSQFQRAVIVVLLISGLSMIWQGLQAS